MIIIGIDPHKGSHTAVALDEDEHVLAELKVKADARQGELLLGWAAPFDCRTWAVEAAGGLGALLAQQLVAAGETVLDVPPALSARVRLLGSGNSDKTDSHDARSAAVVALRNPRLRVVGGEDQRAVLRMLADRRHDLVGVRTQAVCRLHALLCLLKAGGMGRELTAARAAMVLAGIRPTDAVGVERKRICAEIVADVRRLDARIADVRARIVVAVAASKTTVTDVFGVGPVGAALILGHTGDVSRFPSRHHFARYNATAPISASSGPRERHRLNPRGNRQLNHALHVAAVTQIRNDTPGRAYYLSKVEDGKSSREALRALKRRISDAVWRQLLVDASR
ncbi:MAG: IS110 family transposase [Actinomycetota bacterium]|nr:IS110 family transposase [Actinomycetota bacterium]